MSVNLEALEVRDWTGLQKASWSDLGENEKVKMSCICTIQYVTTEPLYMASRTEDLHAAFYLIFIILNYI